MPHHHLCSLAIDEEYEETFTTTAYPDEHGAMEALLAEFDEYVKQRFICVDKQKNILRAIVQQHKFFKHTTWARRGFSKMWFITTNNNKQQQRLIGRALFNFDLIIGYHDDDDDDNDEHE
jgi:hypothetical protein